MAGACTAEVRVEEADRAGWAEVLETAEADAAPRALAGAEATAARLRGLEEASEAAVLSAEAGAEAWAEAQGATGGTEARVGASAGAAASAASVEALAEGADAAAWGDLMLCRWWRRKKS